MRVHRILNGGVPKERFQFQYNSHCIYASRCLVTYQAITAERGTIAELYHDWDTLTKLKNLFKATWPRINLWQPLFNWGKPRNMLLKYQHNLPTFYVNGAEVMKAHTRWYKNGLWTTITRLKLIQFPKRRFANNIITLLTLSNSCYTIPQGTERGEWGYGRIFPFSPLHRKVHFHLVVSFKLKV